MWFSLLGIFCILLFQPLSKTLILQYMYFAVMFRMHSVFDIEKEPGDKRFFPLEKILKTF